MQNILQGAKNKEEQEVNEMKKLLLLANFHSGKGIIKSNLADMIDYYNSRGFEVTVYTSQYSGHITDIVEKTGSLYDNIVCCGGDGTLNEAVNGIMSLEKRPLLGYIPCGSTNDFANSIGIPVIVEDSYKTAVDGKPFTIDIGSINNRYFSYVAGFGLFTSVSYETPQTIKNILGYQAYILTGLKEITNIKTYPVKITYDGGVIEDDVMIGLVSNSNSIAGLKILFENYADLNDGLFEVLLVRKPKNISLLRNIVNCLVEKKFDNDMFYSFKTNKLVIESRDYIKWTVDGEYSGDYDHAEIEVIPGAVDILIDKRASEDKEEGK